MRLALIGYGKMGKAVEQLALQRGHTITAIIDEGHISEISAEIKSIVDVAIEFSSPSSAKNNIVDCLSNGISVVSGTTGWKFDASEMEDLCKNNSAAFFYASNYSIGVNLLIEINNKLATLIERFPDYEAEIEETHHIHKLDKPSGTAITFANGILNNNKKYVNWELNPKTEKNNLGITSFREGEVFGDHKIVWRNEIESISLVSFGSIENGFCYRSSFSR
jgi:4-hydroxy-tetrahydrodipicolinate reductase